MQPALPRLPDGGVPLPRSFRNMTSPVNPSPLRESLLAEATEELEGMKLSTTPEGTPSAAMIKISENAESKKEMTPPASAYTGPLIVDGSGQGESTLIETPATESTSQYRYVTNLAPEDPFLSSPAPQMARTLINSTAMPLEHAILRIQSNLTLPTDPDGYTPRQDRLNEPVTAANAQSVLPAAAAIFIANLSNAKTDDQLEFSVQSMFDVYGKCYVKIRRDKAGQPYSIVQFQTVEDAELARMHANGELIDGRPCRIEVGKAARDVIVSRIGGGTITAHDVVQALGPYGALADMQQTGGRCIDPHQAEAYIAKFAYFQDSRDALVGLKNHSILRVVPAPKDRAGRVYPPIGTPATPGNGPHSNNDSRSIFVGNLPATANEAMLRELFAKLGGVLSVDVISKPISTEIRGMNTFAFVEFQFAGDADAAAKYRTTLGGRALRIERKMYSSRRAARITTEGSPPAQYWPMTTQYQVPNNTPASLTHQYNHAVQMGLPQYQAANLYSHQQRFSQAPAPMYYTSPVPAPDFQLHQVPQQPAVYCSNVPYGHGMPVIPETEENASHEN